MASFATFDKTRSACGPISPYRVRDCVKSRRSSCTGVCPQKDLQMKPGRCHSTFCQNGSNNTPLGRVQIHSYPNPIPHRSARKGMAPPSSSTSVFDHKKLSARLTIKSALNPTPPGLRGEEGRNLPHTWFVIANTSQLCGNFGENSERKIMFPAPGRHRKEGQHRVRRRL